MSDRVYVLVAVETASIQSYIYGSNRLRENVGASYLVAAATGDWALEAVRDLGASSNHADLFDTLRIEEGGLDVEVLYSGGGNIVILFAEQGFSAEAFGENKLPEDALSRQFIRTLSRRVQEQAPGLTLTFSARPFFWKESLCKSVAELLQSMKAQRSEQPALRGNGGLGVQVMCASTSMPAVLMDKEAYKPDANWQPYSAETVAKRAAFELANDTLSQMFNLSDEYRFALDFDDLGRSKEDTSYIAVVHADGNGLGQLYQGMEKDFPAAKNRDYITYIRRMSEGVKAVAQAAQGDMVKALLASIVEEDGIRYLVSVGRKTQKIELKTLETNNGWRTVFPLRPLISGGDDVTFVCDGRIGLDLAVIFLEAFARYSAEMLPVPLTACAGVAIVKTHYPFARAYELADDLAGSAKQARHLLDPDNAPSALDWHITAGGLYGDLEEMREREYTVERKGDLTLRPVFIGDFSTDDPLYARSWRSTRRIITEFQTRWDEHQNKAEGLREVLRKGAIETAIYKVRYLTPASAEWSPGKAPYLPEVAGFNKNGWCDDRCGYYDALELMDKYIPLWEVS